MPHHGRVMLLTLGVTCFICVFDQISRNRGSDLLLDLVVRNSTNHMKYLSESQAQGSSKK